MLGGDITQGIGHSIVDSLLVLQCEFKGGQCAYPSMASGIEVWGGKGIHQWIVVSLYHKMVHMQGTPLSVQ